MQQNSLRQTGFGTIETVIACLVVVVLAAAGWFAYQHNRPRVSNAASDTGATPIHQPATTKPQPTVKYMEIKEWGVKLPLSDQIKDAYYIDGGSSEGLGTPPTRLWLGIKSKSEAKCNPDNNNNGKRGALGALLRFPPDETDAVTGQPLTEEYPDGTTIGNYYYTYQSWKKDNPCAPEEILLSVDTALAAAARMIITSPTTTN